VKPLFSRKDAKPAKKSKDIFLNATHLGQYRLCH